MLQLNEMVDDIEKNVCVLNKLCSIQGIDIQSHMLMRKTSITFDEVNFVPLPLLLSFLYVVVVLVAVVSSLIL